MRVSNLRSITGRFGDCLRSRLNQALLSTVLLSFVSPQPSLAADYPSQIVKIVVPFAAGGGVDVIARIFAPALSQALGQPIVIENKAGAGGMVGAAAAATSAPDGYTLLLGSASTHGTNPNVYTKISYDAVRDFVPIVLVAETPFFLLVAPESPARSVDDFVNLARKKPGALNFGSYGVGSINHLGAELLNDAAKIETNHIPYRGAAPAVTDLIGGRLDFVIDGPSVIGYVQSGTLRMLGATSAKRSKLFPDVPTIAELGVPGYDVSSWYGLFAPAGTPKEVVGLLNRKMNDVLASKEVKDALNKAALDVGGGGSEALSIRVTNELTKWAAIVKSKNIRIDN